MASDATALAAVIGDRVRQERRARGWTLDQLADAAEVSRRLVVNVENGATNPNISTLLKLSDALGVGLPRLVEPPPAVAIAVTRNGDGARLWTGEHGGRGVLLAGTDPPEVVELWDWTLGPGDRHDGDAHATGTRELLQVQKGSVQIRVADRAVVLDTGDAASFPGDAAHAYSNPGPETARFILAVFEPGVRAASVHHARS